MTPGNIQYVTLGNIQYVITMIEKNKYEKIIDIVNDPYINKDTKPHVYVKHMSEDDALIILGTPRKEDAYHGSSFVFSCHRDVCNVNGEIVIGRELEKSASDKITETGCIIRKIHQHPEHILATVPGKQYKKEELESHIHFTCNNKDYSNTIKIAKSLREY